MINYERVAEKLFSIIKGHGHHLLMFTEEGMETSDASEAHRFFVNKPNYMITLDPENRSIKFNKNSNVELKDIESIMSQVKNLATANMLKSEITVFGKEITPKDFAYQAKNYKDKNMNEISEASLSRMHGSIKTSYQTLESVRMIVRHRKPVAEDKRGARSRQIQAIFLEQHGERFRFPHNHLAGARAMTRHMNEGGNMQDTVGEYIIESVGNIIKLTEFVRYARSNKLMNEANEDIVKTVKENIATLRGELKGLIGAKSYATMSETISTREANVLEEDDTTELQDMFTVRKFDEKINDVLPLVKRLMDNKQTWRDAILEASQSTISITEKTNVSEDDVFEFDSPTQRMGYKVKGIAERMIGESDLSTYVSKVAGKLIEGNEINVFEKQIVSNVLANAIIREEEECICEGCGELQEACKCGPKDVVDLISDSYELNMKMLEHEDIFTEENQCSECGGVGEVWGKACEKCGGEEALEESEGEKCIRCRKGTMELGDTMYGPAKACDRCGYQLQVNEADFDDHHAGEVEAGAHSGMPEPFDVNTTDVSEIADQIIDDLAGDFDDPDVILRAVVNFVGDEDPAVDDIYQEVLDRINFQEPDDGQPSEYDEWQDYMGGDDWDQGQFDESLNELRKAAGIEIKEEDNRATCPTCNGEGEVEDDPIGLCPSCDGSGKAPYEKGSRQDPFGGKYNVGVEDFLGPDEADDIF